MLIEIKCELSVELQYESVARITATLGGGDASIMKVRRIRIVDIVWTYGAKPSPHTRSLPRI